MDHRTFVRRLQAPLREVGSSRTFPGAADANQEQPDSILDLVADLDKIFQEFTGSLKRRRT